MCNISTKGVTLHPYSGAPKGLRMFLECPGYEAAAAWHFYSYPLKMNDSSIACHN